MYDSVKAMCGKLITKSFFYYYLIKKSNLHKIRNGQNVIPRENINRTKKGCALFFIREDKDQTLKLLLTRMCVSFRFVLNVFSLPKKKKEKKNDNRYRGEQAS